ncbi:MAG: phosphoribosylformylglycinamidine synthase subunit PurL [Caldilineaceae bacterium]|nr:phosphoribosylformylglycinamidine synthase subunit PurL [Caldilineaceae bacterium]
MTVRIEVRSNHPAAGQNVVRGAAALGITGVTACQVVRLYFLEQDPGAEAVERLCNLLLADPVTETWGVAQREGETRRQGEEERGKQGEDPLTLQSPISQSPNLPLAPHVVEVTFRPGVTDVPARELQRGMVEMGLPACEVATGVRYELEGDLTPDDLRKLARQLLCNTIVQHFAIGEIAIHFGQEATAGDRVETIPVRGLEDAMLLALSKARLLSLDLAEMHAIQRYYTHLERDPTDVELETLAQTWSEHCVHKTFKSKIDFTHRNADGTVRSQETIDGLIHQYLRAATDALWPDWLRSAFVDNAGIIAFDDDYDLAFKVETHNHPSALEPFGGANTGVGGVVRDVIGVSARPIATTDVLCFGPQDFPNDQTPKGMLHPARIAEGVVAGVGDYGNKLGLPTVNGAVIYDEGYLGNPLVFCGCAGLLPHGKHPTAPQQGDLVVALGGRTGRDGIHGATFSSAELTHETSELAGSAVQIGDPITEKGLIELIEAARDRGLYTAITDCGAGGFSSAVGEMGEMLGADVDLARAPLKYPGLAPWEIWISEAQERMVLAVRPGQLNELQQLAHLWDVELSVLGTFTGGGNLVVRFDGRIVGELSMAFLHHGLPRRRMQAEHREPAPAPVSATSTEQSLPGMDINDVLLAMLGHPSVASKEGIVRTYDHEVRGGSVVRPFVGPELDGPADAAVLKPLGTWHHARAFVLSNGINPLLGRVDPYAMAVSAVDEAVRNAVAVGADPERIAILDNFCWGNPTYPDRLGSLVRACQGCYDAALAYRTPFISGKDSLYNEFNGQPIPGTLLISAIGIAPDMHVCVTSALKQPDNRLYLLGETQAELGGSLLNEVLGERGGAAPTMPVAPLGRYRALHGAMRAGLVRACHDLSEGGLAVALAEMCIAGRLGATVSLDALVEATVAGAAVVPLLFSESNGRLLVEVNAADAAAFEAHFAGETLVQVGVTTTEPTLAIMAGGAHVVDLPVDQLVRVWKGQ